jgi:hypothetical protein
LCLRWWRVSHSVFQFPLVEKLEDEHASLVKERHDIIAKRRRLDDEDDLAIFLGSPPRVMEAEPELDELGRASASPNPSMLRPQRRAARKARRAERLQTRPRTVAASGEEEGYSTDDALAPNDTDDYVRALADLGDRARDVLADVRAPEFRDPVRGVAHWFGEWRARYQDMYTGAWGGLGAVGAWEFWARLEILGWEPLAQGARTLDTFGWYVALYEYSRPRSEGDAAADEEPELGPDGDLVSAMIATAVIPRVCKLLKGGMLDAYSAQDVRRLVDFAEQLEVSLERNHAKFQVCSAWMRRQPILRLVFCRCFSRLPPLSSRRQWQTSRVSSRRTFGIISPGSIPRRSPLASVCSHACPSCLKTFCAGDGTLATRSEKAGWRHASLPAAFFRSLRRVGKWVERSACARCVPPNGPFLR